MKKLKKLKENLVAYTVYGKSLDYEKYLENLKQYKEALLKLKDKSLKSSFKKNVPVQPGGRFTLASVVDLNTGIGYIGLSVCDEHDNFSKKDGKNLSIDKAIVYTDKNGDIKSGNPIVKFKVDNIKNKDDKELKKEIFTSLKEIRDLIKQNPSAILPRNNPKLNYPLNGENITAELQKIIKNSPLMNEIGLY